MNAAELKKTVAVELADAFSQRGFRKRSGIVFTVEIAPISSAALRQRKGARPRTTQSN